MPKDLENRAISLDDDVTALPHSMSTSPNTATTSPTTLTPITDPWPKKGVDAVDPTVYHEDYYHGLLPREDVEEMLKENGDFLLRLSEPEHDRLLILSAMRIKEKGPKGIVHFAIAKTDCGFMLDENDPYPTIPEMIKDFMTKKKSISEKFTLILTTPKKRQPWEHKHSDVIPGKRIGEGQYGEVLEGRLIKNGKIITVAIKVTKFENVAKEQIKEIMMEARIMRALHHPHVVRFYGVGALQEPLLVIMELVDEGALDKILHKKTLDIATKTKYCLHASWGIAYLHAQKLLHRDIASRNCLIGGKKLKLSDFGMSRKARMFRLDRKKKIPLRWAAPEALKTGWYNKECDVYSWGVLCWEIFVDGMEPYGDIPPYEIGKKIKNGEQLVFPSVAPTFLVRLIIQKVWCSPEHRYMQQEISTQLEKYLQVTPPSLPNSDDGAGTPRSKPPKKKKH
ncbi:unnamed protein product [Bursaphelenchus okinawaensis]|uniref:Tyrosine-protein kinase n=1 Tax=Bursaphelenchus okinawaensis TaxID=465554 RepID=A0A811KXY4_9BILA|nr:unnamed protein product [Bursaphelenchus okinawaensis]CAG9113508.1 unnamed protein product [Bursaphelenchus okinawaensis]